MKRAFQWFIAIIAIIVLLKLSYYSGVKDGERGLGYWEGWHDAMLVTEFGQKPYNSETALK